MNGTIVIKAEETSKGTRISTETYLKKVDLEDKCTLVHFLCKAVHMSSYELVFCAAMRDAGVLNGDEETMIDLGKIQKAKENMDNES